MALSILVPLVSVGQAMASELDLDFSTVATDTVDSVVDSGNGLTDSEDIPADIVEDDIVVRSGDDEITAAAEACYWCGARRCDCDELFIPMPAYVTVDVTGYTGTWDDYDYFKAAEVSSETFLNVSTEDLLMWYDYEVEGADELLWEIAPAFMAGPGGYEYSSGIVAHAWFNPIANTLDVDVLFMPANSLSAWVDFYTLDEDGELDELIEMEELTGLSYWAAPGQRAEITVEMIEAQLKHGLNQHRPEGYAEGVLYDTEYITPDGEAAAIVVFAPLEKASDKDKNAVVKLKTRRPAAGPKTGDVGNSFMQIAAFAALTMVAATVGLSLTGEEKSKL